MEDFYTEEKNDLTIKIWNDNDAALMFFDDERDGAAGDDVIVCAYHREFTMDKIIKQSIAQSIARGGKYDDDSICDEALKYVKNYHVFGLEAYIHSGIRLAISNEGNFCDRQWDVSQLGLVLVSKKQWRLNKTALNIARGRIEYLNDLLSGNIYGYTIEDAQGNCIDSCGGFTGGYDKYALIEARACIDRMTNKGITDHQGQYLMEFMKG